MIYNSIKIVKGSGGYGGLLVTTSTEEKHKFIYIAGNGEKPTVVDKIVKLAEMEAVNGSKTLVPGDEIALTIIDCGGTPHCGTYPKKGTPTINVVPTSKSSPLTQYINETVYVSAVGLKQVTLTLGEAAADTEKPTLRKTEFKYDISKKITEQKVERQSFVVKIGMGIGKVIAIFNQSAHESIQTMIDTMIPFTALVSLLIGVIQGLGIDGLSANVMTPLAGNIVDLAIISFIYSLPSLSLLSGPRVVVNQVIGTLIGVEIGKGNIPLQLALSALPVINIQSVYDFTPVGLGLEEAEAEIVKIGVPSVLYSRFLSGAPRILVAWLASFGLYS